MSAPDYCGFLTKKGGIRKNWLKRWFELENGELAYWTGTDKKDKKGAVNLFGASKIRASTAETAPDDGTEIEIETEERTWRLRAENAVESAKWLEAMQTAFTAAKATQGKSPAEMMLEAGLVYRCPDLGIPWLGEPPLKSRMSSKPVKAKPFEVYGLHGSVRKLKICVGWWIKGHKAWKHQNGVHAGLALLAGDGTPLDFVDCRKHKAPGIEWELNDPPHKPTEVHDDSHYQQRHPEMWEHMQQLDKTRRKAEKRRAKHWAKKGDDEILKIKFHKLDPAVHYIVPIVSITKPKYAWHLDRKKSVRKLKMRLLHGTKESRYSRNGVPHDEEGREGILEMDLNKLDQDLDSTASSSSDSSDSDGDDAGCESYIMGAIARKGAFWVARCGGVQAAGRSVSDVACNPANLNQILQGLGPTFNEMQKKDVTVQVLGCRNVLARDGATSDCYCKIKYKKVNTIKSEVVKKTVNPVWTLPEVRMGTVDPAGYKAFMIKIWDDDTFSDDFIGALKLRPGMFFGGITPGVHDLWLPLAPDRDHLSTSVQGDIHLKLTVQDVSVEE